MQGDGRIKRIKTSGSKNHGSFEASTDLIKMENFISAGRLSTIDEVDSYDFFSGLVVQYFILCYGRNYLYDDIDRICIFSPDCSSISYKMAHFNQCIFLNAYFVGHDGMCYANVFDLLEG